MPWIFGSFLLTPCAFRSCHVVISKQGSTIRAVGYNRCVTGRRPGEKHVVRFRKSAENRSRARDTQPIRGVPDELARGYKRWHPWFLEDDMERRSPLSDICLSTHLSHTSETSTLLRIKCERYIFIKKCVPSFIEVRILSLIMFPLVFVCGYTTETHSENERKLTDRYMYVGKLIHKELCKRYWNLTILTNDIGTNQKNENVVENETNKILWDLEIQTDHPIPAWRPDHMLINKKWR